MYMIAAGNHPLSLREFATRTEAIAVASAWGMAPWRVFLNLTHAGRGKSRVPSA